MRQTAVHPPESTAVKSPRKWAHRVVIAAMVILVGRYYLWAVRATGDRFEWGYDLSGYYNLLAQALAKGHLYLPIQPSPQLLAQPNPWDPGVDSSLKWHDMVLFNGHYYLYFGAAPAVLLFTPWRLMTGHDLSENFGMFLLCFGGFLFSCASLVRILDLASVTPGPFLLAFMLLALGVCQSVPYLLNRVAVYEIAIAGGYFCVSAAIYFITVGIRSRLRARWFAAAAILFGLAVASRPHLVLAGIVAMAGVLVALSRTGGWISAVRSREFVAFALAFLIVGLAVGAYNYERFGNPFEFGFRYQLAGVGQNRIELSARNLVPGMYFMLLSRPELSPVFPWMRMVFRFPFDSAERHPLPPGYFVEPTVGALWLAPFLVAALAVPRARALPADVRTILWIVAASSTAVLLFLISTHLATHRYEVDFVPLAALGALANLGICSCRGSGFRRAARAAVLVAIIGYSAVANLALGIAGPYNDLLKNRPASYVRIAGWFSPVRQFRPVASPPITVEMDAAFVPKPAGLREPLVTIGHSHFHYFLYVEHGAGTLRFISQSEDSRLSYDMSDPSAAPVRIRLAYSPESRRLTIAVNGKEVIVHPVERLITAPAQVAIGENFSDLGLTARRFEGRIRLVTKTVGGF